MGELQGYSQSQLIQINSGVESQYISTRDKGNKTYRYVEASYIIELLNKLFGYTWNWEVDTPEIHLTGGKDKNGNDKCYVTVHGRLTVPVLNPNFTETASDYKDRYIWIMKESFGSHLIAGTDPEVQGFAYKAAATDALKKCASMLGIAKNVYMSEELFTYLQENGEVDEWTDETIKMYKEQYDKMMDLYRTNSDLPKYIHDFCTETKDYSEMDRITPGNVINFLAWVQNRISSIEETLNEQEIESTPPASSAKKRAVPTW